MSGQLFVLPKQVPLTTGPAFLPGAKAYFYINGTSTLQDTYSDLALTTPHSNPVIADGNGVFAPIYLDSTKRYKVRLTTSGDVEVYTEDDFTAVTGTTFASNDVRFYDALGLGADESTEFQAAVDANKGGVVIVPEAFEILAAGVLLSGSTYNNTTIIVKGTFKLAARSGADNFQAACFAGIIVHDCDNVTVEIHDSDGNRANQDDKEQIYILLIAGASNYSVPILRTREIRGDGIYISQEQLTSDSFTPINGHLGEITGSNTVDDGRNLISVISCDGLTIDVINSVKIGADINGFTMPGGIDIEPDWGYQNAENIVIGQAYIETAGTGGLTIAGKAVTDDATRDWNTKNISIDNAIVKKTGIAAGGLSAATFVRCSDLRLNCSVYYATTKGKGVQIDFADRVTGHLTVRNVSIGVSLGTAEEVRDFDLSIFGTDYSTCGLRTTNVTRGTFRGRIYGTSGTGFAIQCHDEARVSITQTDINYAIDAPYDGANLRAFRNETGATVAYSGCVIRNCDFSGYTSPPATCDAEILKVDVLGMNWASSIPTSGTWFIGDLVRNTSPSEDANQMIQLGWIRLTTGTGNTVNTDWEYIRTSTVSPASP